MNSKDLNCVTAGVDWCHNRPRVFDRLVKWPRHHPFTVATRVQISYRSLLGFNSMVEDTAYIRVVAGSIPAIPTRGLAYSLTGVCEWVIKETHNKQAASRKYNKSSSDRTTRKYPYAFGSL